MILIETAMVICLTVSSIELFLMIQYSWPKKLLALKTQNCLLKQASFFPFLVRPLPLDFYKDSRIDADDVSVF